MLSRYGDPASTSPSGNNQGRLMATTEPTSRTQGNSALDRPHRYGFDAAIIAFASGTVRWARIPRAEPAGFSGAVHTSKTGGRRLAGFAAGPSWLKMPAIFRAVFQA